MKSYKLPQTDSIEKLADFWDSHDLTEFEDQLEEVPEPVFGHPSAATMVLRLQFPELDAVKRIARVRGVEQGDLIREWVLEGLEKDRARK